MLSLRLWRNCLAALLLTSFPGGPDFEFASAAETADRAAPRNVVLVLSDDHRYDFLGFLPGAPKFLETPHLDRMAAEGRTLGQRLCQHVPVLAQPRVHPDRPVHASSSRGR